MDRSTHAGLRQPSRRPLSVGKLDGDLPETHDRAVIVKLGQVALTVVAVEGA